jgi:hypothetical protein
MRTIVWLSTITLTMLICAPVSSHAQASLEGMYAFAAEGSGDVQGAIDATVAKMSFIKRPIARSRLKKTNPIYKTVAISRSGNEITVDFNGGTLVTMPADGSSTRWKRDDGEVFEVSARWQGSTLTQSFKAEDGERLNTYHLNTDGRTLTLDVKISSEQLPAPLTYSLSYRRADR